MLIIAWLLSDPIAENTVRACGVRLYRSSKSLTHRDRCREPQARSQSRQNCRAWDLFLPSVYCELQLLGAPAVSYMPGDARTLDVDEVGDISVALLLFVMISSLHSSSVTHLDLDLDIWKFLLNTIERRAATCRWIMAIEMLRTFSLVLVWDSVVRSQSIGVATDHFFGSL